MRQRYSKALVYIISVAAVLLTLVFVYLKTALT